MNKPDLTPQLLEKVEIKAAPFINTYDKALSLLGQLASPLVEELFRKHLTHSFMMGYLEAVNECLTSASSESNNQQTEGHSLERH